MTSYSSRKKILGLVVWLGVSFAAAFVGAMASVQAETFYSRLSQPAWAPPSWVFGPVWTLLYALMGIAAWLVWLSGGFTANRKAFFFFLAQLGVNALWSWLFFKWHRGYLAFMDTLALLLLIAVTLALFWRVRPLAGALLVPYLLWVMFASALNYSIWRMNPAVLG